MSGLLYPLIVTENFKKLMYNPLIYVSYTYQYLSHKKLKLKTSKIFAIF